MIEQILAILNEPLLKYSLLPLIFLMAFGQGNDIKEKFLYGSVALVMFVTLFIVIGVYSIRELVIAWNILIIAIVFAYL